jgi:hypothetical protein
MQGSDAIEAALALYRQPSLARQMEHAELPAGMIDVLRVAAAPLEDTQSVADDLGADAQELFDASLFFLQTSLFHPGANDARIMALGADATPAQLRDHKRLLLKWLHPDRNRNNWENKLFNRALDAATRLEHAFCEGLPIDLTAQVSRNSALRARRKEWRLAQQQRRMHNVWRGFFFKLKRKALLILVLGCLVGGVIFSFEVLPHRVFTLNEAAN